MSQKCTMYVSTTAHWTGRHLGEDLRNQGPDARCVLALSLAERAGECRLAGVNVIRGESEQIRAAQVAQGTRQPCPVRLMWLKIRAASIPATTVGCMPRSRSCSGEVCVDPGSAHDQLVSEYSTSLFTVHDLIFTRLPSLIRINWRTQDSLCAL